MGEFTSINYIDFLSQDLQWQEGAMMLASSIKAKEKEKKDQGKQLNKKEKLKQEKNEGKREYKDMEKF